MKTNLLQRPGVHLALDNVSLVVPEPGSASLFVAGVGLLLIAGRIRK